LKIDLLELKQRLKAGALEALVTPRWLLMDLQKQLHFFSPANRLRSDRQRLDEIMNSMEKSIAHRLALSKARLQGLERRLFSLNPAAVLARGFAIVSTPERTLLKSVNQAEKGDLLTVRLHDGRLNVRVNEVKRSGDDG
jgi:exodeoxyribonuclease VII large subunit